MSIEPIFSAFFGFGYFLIVLGLAVVFHEWGHFIIAKWVGAKVERFAVGFGKPLFTYRWHDTEYAICMLPLGGYVKITGMDPEDELTGAHWEYLQLSPWKRIAIVVAGPLMNFVLAFLIYVLLFSTFGQPVINTTTVGFVPKGSWGWEMGIREGDRIVAVNDVEAETWGEVLELQNRSINGVLRVTIERNGETLIKEKEIHPSLDVELEVSSSYFVPDEHDGMYITGVLPDGAADRAGLQAGWIITGIDGIRFETSDQFAEYVASRYEQTGEGEYRPIPVTLEVETQDGETLLLEAMPDLRYPSEDAIPNEPVAFLGFTYQGEWSVMQFLISSQLPTAPRLGVGPLLTPVIGNVQEGGVARRAGIAPNSRIVEIDGKPINDWTQLLMIMQDTLQEDETGNVTARSIDITWLTPEQEMRTATIEPNVIEQPILTRASLRSGKHYAFAQLGVDRKPDRRQLGLIAACVEGWNRTLYFTQFTINFIYELFTGQVSVRLVGGPIAIFQMSDEQGRWGIERLLGFIAILSINLGLLNLFPLPPLDGGHLVFYLYEIVRRKPITLSHMENFGKIGFILIVPLLLFVVINDLVRVQFFSWIASLFGLS